MGTSKGYIAPTTIHWSKSKRAVTGFIKNGDNDSKIKAASRFAEAMKQDISSSASFISATGKILSFINNASSIGLNNALQQIDRLDLIDKEPGEVLDALLNHFTNNGNTVEDYLAAQAIGEAFSNLKIENIADINNISTEAFLIEVLAEYIKFSFEFRYSEKIARGRTIAEAKEILAKMQEYICNKIHFEFKDKLKYISFENLKTDDYVEFALKEALELFLDFYENGD